MSLTFIRENWVPPGGYRYLQPESGAEFKENYWLNLTRKVRAHREANNYPIGPNFEQQLIDYNCQLNPELCIETQGETRAGRAINFATAMLRWIRNGMPVVTPEEYQRRLDLCETCPNFRGERANYTASCGRCGCNVIKLNLATEHCPLDPPRW